MLSHKTIIYSAFTLIAACSSASVFAKDGERTINLQEDVARAELIKLSIPAAQVRITGTTGNSLTAEITASCQAKKSKESCSAFLKELGWTKKIGTTIELGLAPSDIKHYDDVTVEVKFGVPKDKKLEISLSAGELAVEGTSACLNADMGAGQIRINLKETQLASASLSAKVGDVNLTTAKTGKIEGDRSLLVGAKLDWNKGTGTCHTKASTLAGEVQLILN